MFTNVRNRINHCVSSIFKSDLKDFEEFEKEIDAQVDAALYLANGLDECTEPHGITENAKFSLNYDDYAAFNKAMDDLNGKIKQRRQQRSRLRFIMILVLFLITWPVLGKYVAHFF